MLDIQEGEAALAARVRGATGPLAVRGGGTRGVAPAVDAEPIETSGVSGIRLYDPGALTLVAGAGTPLAEVEAALAAEGQALPFEPGDLCAALGTTGSSTIGGVVATNASGPRRFQAGACRDSLIGVRFVDGRGDVITNGGRVMKNVTGYDLVKLMAGSHGTLGVLTEVSFKVLPAPATRAVLLIDGLDIAQAVAAMGAALRSPFEVTGAAHVPVGLDGAPVTMIRIEGFEASVSYRTDRLREVLAPFGAVTVETDADKTRAGWDWVRDGTMFAGGTGDLWRLSVAPTDAVEIAARLDDARLLFDWGGGRIWAEVSPGTDLRGLMAGIGGHATILRAGADTLARLGRFHPDPAPLAAIAAKLRAQFDPRGILTPGVMG